MVLSLLACLICHVPLNFDVGASTAEQAIAVWSQQAHLQVLYRYRLVVGLKTPSVSGTFEPLEALRKILSLTRLQAEYVNPRTVAVFEDKHYCHPDWGALEAPLPPCLPQPLIIRATP